MVRPGREFRVFVVDDHDAIASSVAMILRFQGGFHAKSFTDPLEALRASECDAPDLLISDVVMPQLSGIDLAIRLLERRPECRVLLFSGQSETASLLEAATARGYTFEMLTKPVHPAVLLSSIQRVMEGQPALFPPGAGTENSFEIGLPAE